MNSFEMSWLSLKQDQKMSLWANCLTKTFSQSESLFLWWAIIFPLHLSLQCLLILLSCLFSIHLRYSCFKSYGVKSFRLVFKIFGNTMFACKCPSNTNVIAFQKKKNPKEIKNKENFSLKQSFPVILSRKPKLCWSDPDMDT